MVEHVSAHTSPELDRVFGALSHQLRRDMLDRLSQGELPVTQLAASYDLSLNGVSKHVKVLEGAGLVRRTRDGRLHRLRAETAPLVPALDYLERARGFWETSLDALARLAERHSPPAETSHPQ